MKSLEAILAALLVVSLLAPAGCKNKAKDISTPKYLLARLHEHWKAARETLESDQPNLGVLRTVNHFLRFRVPRRIEKQYGGRDKQQVLAKLRELGKAYRDQVQMKLDTRGNEVRLAPGVTLEQLRQAFAKLDEQYREFESLTGGV